MNGGYYQWYDEMEMERERVLAREGKRKQLKVTLCAIVIFVLATYLAAIASSFQVRFIYYSLDIRYGDSYVLDRIFDIFTYTCQLIFPAVVYLLVRRIPLRGCFYFSGASHNCERVTPFTVLRYFFIAFAISCSFSYIISIFTSLSGLDSSVFDMPTAMTPIEFVFDILTVAILPALFEEFVFRGVLLASLLPFGRSFAIVASAIIFASVHGSIEQIGFAFVYGVIFAFVAVKTGSLLTGIVMHFLNNAFSCIVDYCLVNYPGIATDLVIGAVSTVMILLGFIGAAYLIGKGRFELSEESDGQLLSVSETFRELCSPLMICFYLLVLAETVISYIPGG